MSGPVLQTKSLVKRFGGFVATDHVDFELKHGEMHAVIGPNGAGKTTFIKQLTGELTPDEGQIFLDGADVTRKPTYARILGGVGRSFQVTSVLREFTALENVMLAVHAKRRHSFRFWRSFANYTDVKDAALHALHQAGLGDRAHYPASDLGYGALRQLELAMVISTQPKVLLLDEPMAGMGTSEAMRVVELIASFRGQFTILLVEHDMSAVFALADRITVLFYGRVLACGTVNEIKNNPDVRASYLGATA